MWGKVSHIVHSPAAQPLKPDPRKPPAWAEPHEQPVAEPGATFSSGFEALMRHASTPPKVRV